MGQQQGDRMQVRNVYTVRTINVRIWFEFYFFFKKRKKKKFDTNSNKKRSI